MQRIVTAQSSDGSADGPGAASDEAVRPTVLNEILVSTAGGDSEYVELFGAAGASLAGLSVAGVLLEGDRRGDVQFRYDFAAGDALGANGFFLLGNDTAAQTYGVSPDAAIDANALQNASATFALIETATLTGDAVTGGEAVIDAVSLVESAEVEGLFGSPALGPDGRFLPAGVGRVADGADTDAAEDFAILSFGNDAAVNTPTAASGAPDDGGSGGSIDDAPTLISAVQGSADASPLVGQTVVVEGIVTGDFQTGDADAFRDLGGFFLMEEDGDRDADAATSEGVFVSEGDGASALDVEDGDRVRVLGTVVERFGRTTIDVSEARVEAAGAVADPLTLAVSTALPGVAGREALEAMLVTVDEPLTFSESFDYEDFQTATLSVDGPVYQYTQQNAPDADGFAAYEAAVADRLVLIDDGTDGRRADFDPILAPDGTPIADPSAFRMGTSVEDLTAIFDYGFGDFRLRLPDGVGFDLDAATNPVPDGPVDVGGNYRVASFNVLNYFTTLDDGSTTDIGADPRGAESAEELARQEAKIVEAITGLDADVVGLVEIENDFAGDGFALQTLVDAINASLGGAFYDFVDPGTEFVGGDAIAVAFIYDTRSTALVGDAAILDADAFLDPLGTGTGGDGFNRAALAQSFEEIGSGGVFTASVNHFKSKGSLTGAPEDEDQGDGAGRNDETRTQAAEALADWLADDPTGVGDPDTLILGDLNAYARERPITALEGAGYTDLARTFEGDDVYSYRFSGQIGTLDYALANEALLGQVTGAETVLWNADTPVVFDYNLDDTFTGPNILRPTDQGLFDGESPLRASDHDPVVVGLALDADDGVGAPTVVLGTGEADTFTFAQGSGVQVVDGFAVGGAAADALTVGDGPFAGTYASADDLVSLVREIETDGVGATDAFVSGDALAFVFDRTGAGDLSDAVVLLDVVGADGLTRAALDAAGVDDAFKFPDAEDDTVAGFVEPDPGLV